MPTYEFRCPQCSKTEEHNFSFTEEMLPLCFDCNVLMTKVFQAPPIHFKGTGWGKD